jgi:hypothetical protein
MRADVAAPFLVIEGAGAKVGEPEGEPRVLALLSADRTAVNVTVTGRLNQWSSKKKVPIAGYLCRFPTGNVGSFDFISLPTPCVPMPLLNPGAPVTRPAVAVGSVTYDFQSWSEAVSACFAFGEAIAEDTGFSHVSGSALQAPEKPSLWAVGERRVLAVVADWGEAETEGQSDALEILPRVFELVRAELHGASMGMLRLNVTVYNHVVRYSKPRSLLVPCKHTFGCFFPRLVDEALADIHAQRPEMGVYGYDIAYVVHPRCEPEASEGAASLRRAQAGFAAPLLFTTQVLGEWINVSENKRNT